MDARMSSALLLHSDVMARASFLSAARRKRASRLVIVAACLAVRVNHSLKADTARKVLELIFHGMVAQNTVTLSVKLSRHMRSSVSAVGFFNHKTVPSSVSSASTK